MDQKQFCRMQKGNGFIAALDQSGGSTPKALRLYGIPDGSYHGDEEMFDLIHEMRTRIITSPAFTSEHILGAILFENTMDRQIEGKYTADYLWEEKGILPILKVDKGLAEQENGVCVMKPILNLDELLKRANDRHIFGTKMRSVIKAADPYGIKKIVDQQFEIGCRIAEAGLVPILEPEVDIFIPDKENSEKLLKKELLAHLSSLDPDIRLMFKLTIPSTDDFYLDLINDPHVVRVAALSGGYSQIEANQRLARNHGLIASFSRALTAGLQKQQTDEEFNAVLKRSIDEIYKASMT